MMTRRLIAILFWASFQLICPQSKTAFASDAEVHVAPNGAATGTVNGSPIPAFRLAVTHSVLPSGSVQWQITEAPPNGPIWCGGITDGSLWCDFSCRVGWFDRWTYPPPALGHGEPIGYVTSLSGYGLDDEPVNVSREGAGYCIRIGTPPPVLMPAVTLGDLFAYLQAWFAGTVSETPVEFIGRYFAR